MTKEETMLRAFGELLSAVEAYGMSAAERRLPTGMLEPQDSCELALGAVATHARSLFVYGSEDLTLSTDRMRQHPRLVAHETANLVRAAEKVLHRTVSLPASMRAACGRLATKTRQARMLLAGENET